MNRRSLLTTLAVTPLVAYAQTASPRRRVGYFTPDVGPSPARARVIDRLLEGLRQAGWSTDRNLELEVRFAGAGPDGLMRQAADLIASKPDVIVASAVGAAVPLLELTTTLPIVIAVGGDPVAGGLTDSLARPSRKDRKSTRLNSSH